MPSEKRWWVGVNKDWPGRFSIWVAPDGDPFAQIVSVYDWVLPANQWPREGWRMAPEDLTCPFGCGAGNRAYSSPLIELSRDRSGGLTIVCSCCGKAGPCIIRDGLPMLLQPTKG